MDKRFITADEAIQLLPDSDIVHTFRNPSGIMLGADWSKKSVIEAINKYQDALQLTGSMARGMGHGIALFDDDILFIETDKNKLELFDPLNK